MTNKNKLRPLRQVKENLPKLENHAFAVPDVKDWLDGLPLRELYRLHYDLRHLMYFSIGRPSSRWVNLAFRDVPRLNECVKKQAVLKRVTEIAKRPARCTNVLADFFPELNALCQASYNAILQRSVSGLEKAEGWLAAVTSGLGLTYAADLEAAVYLASRSDTDTPTSQEITRAWRADVCAAVVVRKSKNTFNLRNPKDVSLRDAAEILKWNGILPPFWNFRDEEEDFVAATMLRAADWFDVPGFDEWWVAATRDLSAGPQFGIEPAENARWLFDWCRCDMALRIADKTGLEAWLWGLSNGLHERDAPWRIFDGRRNNPGLRDLVYIAACFAFAWKRIGQSKTANSKIFDAAVLLLLQTQLPCGGWPLFTDEKTPCLLTTCYSLHALAVAKPRGWKAVAQTAADWLWKQQRPIGCWEIEGGPTIMLTVLTLDSISLANEGLATFGRSVEPPKSAPTGELLKVLLKNVVSARRAAEKGTALEKLMKALFETVPDFKVRTNIRTATEEIDISIVNGNNDPIFRDEGPIVLGECKNWSTKCGKNEFVLFHGKIQNRKQRAKLGFLISWKGFADTITSEMLRGSREEYLIVPLDGSDIRRAVAEGTLLPILRESWEKAVHL